MASRPTPAPVASATSAASGFGQRESGLHVPEGYVSPEAPASPAVGAAQHRVIMGAAAVRGVVRGAGYGLALSLISGSLHDSLVDLAAMAAGLVTLVELGLVPDIRLSRSAVGRPRE
jgi:hypothetical protein